MPSRLGEYESILKASLDNGYRHLTLSEYFDIIISGKDTGNCFLNRHDIDTDVRTARRMFEIEKNLGIKSSFYFRLNNLDFELMKEIHEYGSEVGYHYEELSQFCKDNRIFDPTSIKKRYLDIERIFIRNFNSIEKRCGFKIKSVASHGDFVNRKLGIPNYDFMTRELMDKCQITFECYDKRLISSFDMIISDTHYPVFYRPLNPLNVINDSLKVIYLLSHPRHWRTAPIENTSDNIKRLFEGFKFK